MQKLIFSITLIGLFASIMPLNAQSTNNEVGLKVEKIRPTTAISPFAKPAKTLTPLLNLPKLNDPSVRVKQNIFYSQISYPQAYLNKNHSNHYQLMDRQLLTTQNAKDLFVERLVEAAFSKLFNLD